VVLDGYTLNPGDNPWDDLNRLGQVEIHDRTPPEKVAERCRGAEVVITNKVPVRAPVMGQLPDLKLIAVSATGFDCVDVDAAAQKGVPVCNVPTYGTESVAEHTLALMLEFARRPMLHDRAVREGEWEDQPDWCFWKAPLFEMAGKTLGVVGFGRIGRRVGQLGHALGMDVLAHDLVPENPPDYQPFAFVDQQELFVRSDFVTIHTYQTPDNEKFINRDALAAMKPTAFLINTARGGLVNEGDLIEALQQGRIAGAALDVASREPLPRDHPLLAAPNLIVTPHIAWAAVEARQRLMKTTVDNVASFIEGRPRNVVNNV
jgi:glycerate dehydrogenase